MLVLSIFMIAVVLPATTSGMPAGSTSTQANSVSQPSGSSNKESAPSIKVAGSSAWQHPGFVVSKSQLAFVKTQIAAKSQPWTSALSQMLEDHDRYGKYVSAQRRSKAHAKVECGPTTNPDIGCTDERGDALAAWANALAGYVSGDETHTKNAIALMNKWSGVVKGHSLDNAVLQTAWAGASWARAGELVRHTTKGLWKDADIKAFEQMLLKAYLPAVKDGSPRAPNWDLACLNAAVGIAVFLEDKKAYDNAMSLFHKRVPTYIYLEKDGKSPKTNGGKSQNWYGQEGFANKGQSGQIAETCRDLTHAGYSLSSISHILETARIQGDDQYKSDAADRLMASLEFHSQHSARSPVKWLCKGKPLTRNLEFVTEIGLNAFGTRMGQKMSFTEDYSKKHRPAGTNNLFYGWETLTHAENKA